MIRPFLFSPDPIVMLQDDMRYLFVLLLSAVLLLPACHTPRPARAAAPPVSAPQKKFSLAGQAQGTTWMISYYASDSLIARAAIDSLLAQLDHSLSIYQPASLINVFNRSEKGMQLDRHLYAVVKKALHTYRDTKGRFDFTVQPLVQAWGFGPRSIDHLPDSQTIRSIRECVGSHLLVMKGKKLVKKKNCVTIDVNGIAQGYSVDQMADLLQNRGIQDFVVELGGEIRVLGRHPSGEPMKIGIETPADEHSFEPYVQKTIALDRGAITTSGNYRKVYEWQGKQIHHLIDPSTGYPANNELLSVTVYAPDAITADAYDNALMLMGLKEALRFVDSHPGIAAHFIFRDANGNIADTASSRFPALLDDTHN